VSWDSFGVGRAKHFATLHFLALLFPATSYARVVVGHFFSTMKILFMIFGLTTASGILNAQDLPKHKIGKWPESVFQKIVTGQYNLVDDLKKANGELKKDDVLNLKEKKNFQSDLEDKIDDIEFGNQTDLTEIWNWFSSHGQWTATMGQMNEELRERIFERADRWKKARS